MIQVWEPHIERVNVVFNPTYPHGEWDANVAASRLEEFMPVPIIITPTVKGGAETNAEMLHGITQPGDVIALKTGDGTAGQIITAVRSPLMAELNPYISLTSLNNAGNGGDFGRSLHGRWNTDPRDIFSQHLQAVTAHALRVTIEDGDGQTNVYNAASYIGFGKSAIGTEIVNSPRYKEGSKFVGDVGLMTSILSSDHSFTVTAENGKSSTFGEITYVKISDMAKIGRYPVKLWAPELRVTPVSAGRQAGAFAAGALLFGKAAGFNTDQPSRFTTETPVPMHFDGEPPVTIRPGSMVEVALAPETYTVLTTRLPYGQHAQ